MVIPLAWLAFTLAYTGASAWLTPRRFAFMALIPLLTLVLVWTNDLHHLVYAAYRLDTSRDLALVNPTYGVWFWVYIAYKLNDQLSFGLGADIYTFSGLFGEGHLEQKSIWPGGLGIPAGSLMEINGSDTTAGFNVSLLYTPFRNSDGKPLVNIGMVYRSQATFHLTGNFLANGASVAGATATFVLPQVFSGGIGIWPVRTSEREWKLEFDVDYTGWKSNRNLDVHLTNGALLPFPQNWQSTYTVMIGTEYRWLRLASMPDWDIALRAGYMNQQAQIPDRTFNPGVPSANTHIPSVGIGLACHENGSFLGNPRRIGAPRILRRMPPRSAPTGSVRRRVAGYARTRAGE